MLIIKVKNITDKRIINALKRRQNDDATFWNEPQEAAHCEVQQYYIPYNGKQYIVVEHCSSREYYVKGLQLFFYEFVENWEDFPVIEFSNTNHFQREVLDYPEQLFKFSKM